MKARGLVSRTQTIDEFAQANRKDLERMAAYILKRWPAPNDYGPEDVVQDLLFECWRQRLRFDPARGKTPESFLSFNAISYAKRQVHKARRARGDKALGKFELLTTDGDAYGVDGFDPLHNTQIEIDRRDHLRGLMARCATAREAVCLFVFYEEEDTRAAGDRIYKDAQLRELCRVRCAEEAREAVKQVAKEHACLE